MYCAIACISFTHCRQMLTSHPLHHQPLLRPQHNNHEVAIVAILHARDTLSPAMFFQVSHIVSCLLRCFIVANWGCLILLVILVCFHLFLLPRVIVLQILCTLHTSADRKTLTVQR